MLFEVLLKNLLVCWTEACSELRSPPVPLLPSHLQSRQHHAGHEAEGSCRTMLRKCNLAHRDPAWWYSSSVLRSVTLRTVYLKYLLSKLALSISLFKIKLTIVNKFHTHTKASTQCSLAILTTLSPHLREGGQVRQPPITTGWCCRAPGDAARPGWGGDSPDARPVPR